MSHGKLPPNNERDLDDTKISSNLIELKASSTPKHAPAKYWWPDYKKVEIKSFWRIGMFKFQREDAPIRTSEVP